MKAVCRICIGAALLWVAAAGVSSSALAVCGPVCATEELGHDLGGAVDDAVDDTKDAVQQQQDHVRDVVDAVIGSTPPAEPVPDPEEGSGDPHAQPARDHRSPTSNRPRTSAKDDAAGTSSGVQVRRADHSTARDPMPQLPPHPSSPSLERDEAFRAPGVRDVAVGIALPIVILLAIALAFIALQDQIDRRDPKLALASVQPDVVRFQ